MSSTHSRSVSLAAVALAILTSLAGPIRPARAETAFEVVQRFPSSEVNLTVGSNGNVYGVATHARGPGASQKTAFRIDGAGTFTTLHTFANFGWYGPAPASRLIVGQDGALYGTTPTATGGGPTRGEFFRLDNAGSYTLLFNFPLFVGSPLILGQDGAFYARIGPIISAAVGAFYDSHLFRIDSAGNFTLLTQHDWWSHPVPSVVGSDGALYGTKDTAPAHIFRQETPSGSYTVLHVFDPYEGFPNDFVLGSDGLIYGVSPDAGPNGFGNVFRFDNAGNFTVLHEFSGLDGVSPIAPLTVGSDGAVYGVTEDGGPGRWPDGTSCGGGTVFRIDQAGTFTTLHALDCVRGYPNQPLTLGKDGALYGTTWSNTSFRVDNAGNFTSQPFDTTEYIISTTHPLVQSPADCAFYGVVEQYGQGYEVDQTVYRMFEPRQLCQHIDFDPLPDRTLRDPPFTVSATASSGLPVSFSASGRCTLSGDQVRLKRGVGVCRVTAYQDGDSRFAPAADVVQEFRVRPPGRRRSLR